MYCTYCGDVADTFDHIVPVAYRHNSRKKSENRDMAVPCCRECRRGRGKRRRRSIRWTGSGAAGCVSIASNNSCGCHS